jgi:hypothetical protein
VRKLRLQFLLKDLNVPLETEVLTALKIVVLTEGLEAPGGRAREVTSRKNVEGKILATKA